MRKVWFLLISCFFSSALANDCLIEAETIINSIRSFEADFVEENYQTGKKTQGKIFVKKPGLMRLDYLKPDKMSLFLKDNIITHYNYELEEVSYLQDQEASFLAKDKINFLQDFEKSWCKKEGNTIRFLVQKKDWLVELLLVDQKLEGFTTFADKVPISLVIFSKEAINLQLKDDIFTFKDKKFFNHE
jgi:outer membrane lipoprotein-sorting protein